MGLGPVVRGADEGQQAQQRFSGRISGRRGDRGAGAGRLLGV
jgi:hypothetical protein